ncbi:MAG TPA: ABC transporter ATP-binding protein [Microlunatus sp.]|nr:ABC transporter ATP-binding protein [Microlunatus sp.]
MSLLEMRNLTHTYATGSGRPVLYDVSLDTEEGEILALVGESGCGKTTLGRLVAGLHQPSQGSIVFDGTDITDLRGGKRREWRRQVQMVHQDPYGSLNPGLTIGSTLAPGMLRHKLATWRNVQQKMIKLLQQVGLDATPAFLQRYPHQLSGGQRQRVSIARAISLQPRLIVADEVTSMLDVSMRVAILDLLLSFQRELGIGYVFISHDFGVVRYFAQGGRIAVMFFGHVVEEGPVEQVITTPKHPYTHMLLQAIPVPDPVLVRKRDEADDAPKRMTGEPATKGCVFANRCPLVQDRCRKEAPPLTQVGDRHRTACFYSDEVPPLQHLTEHAA